MATLLNIPLEVLLLITSHLTTPEYGNLRATCKRIEAALFAAFSKEFFSKRSFALIEFSIQALVDIAKSRLGPSLTHLIIHLDHPEAAFTPLYSLAPSGHRAENAAANNRILAESLNHAVFISTGLDVEMLSEAMRHLPNLTTIGMRDFVSASRTRDDTKYWNNYGCPTYVAETGARLGLPGCRSHFRLHDYTSHVFLTILRAMGRGAVSGHNPRLTRLEVLLHRCPFLDQAFMIPRHLDAEISAALHKLTSILIDGLTDEYPDFVSLDENGRRGRGYFLSRFLIKMPNLKHLRLNFQRYRQENSERVLLWLADTPTGTSLNHIDSLTELRTSSPLPALFPPSPAFPSLKALDLGMLAVKESTLLALYTKFRHTLRSISLHKTALYSKKAPPGPKPDGVASLLHGMARRKFKLTYIRLSNMQQLNGPGQEDVRFKGCKDPAVKIWYGDDFVRSVEDIIKDIEVDWNSHSHIIDGDSDEDEDMD